MYSLATKKVYHLPRKRCLECFGEGEVEVLRQCCPPTLTHWRKECDCSSEGWISDGYRLCDCVSRVRGFKARWFPCQGCAAVGAVPSPDGYLVNCDVCLGYGKVIKP